MVVGVDQAGHKHVTAQIDHPVGARRQRGTGTSGLDYTVADKHAAVAVFPARHHPCRSAHRRDAISSVATRFPQISKQALCGLGVLTVSPGHKPATTRDSTGSDAMLRAYFDSPPQHSLTRGAGSAVYRRGTAAPTHGPIANSQSQLTGEQRRMNRQMMGRMKQTQKTAEMNEGAPQAGRIRSAGRVSGPNLKALLTVVLALAGGLALSPASYADDDVRSIQVSGEAERRVAPDMALLSDGAW
jgi:hypothetical protein